MLSSIVYVAVKTSKPGRPTVGGNPNVDDGDSATFWCESNPPAPSGSTYVWSVNGRVISGARAQRYTARSVSTGNTNDEYTCAVRTGGRISQTSEPLVLLGMYTHPSQTH